MVVVMVAIVIGVLGTAPKPVSFTPSGTLTILSTILGFTTTSAFSKLTWESFPAAAEH